MFTIETEETSNISASNESIESTTFSESDDLTSDGQWDLESDVESVETKSKTEEVEKDEEDDDDLTTWNSTDTAIEKGIPRRKENHIPWKCPPDVSVEEIYKAFGIVEGEEPKLGNLTPLNVMETLNMKKDGDIPSMWDYDKSCMPKELIDLDANTFLIDPSKLNLCFLTTEILARICAMLIPLDFVNLSLTCRYLHWRMFSFCTCYAPNWVRMVIHDECLTSTSEYAHFLMPQIVYFFDGDTSIDNDRIGWNMELHKDYRGFSVMHPPCLKKPFFFETLELCLTPPLFDKENYDRCLPHVMAVRNRARRLFVKIFPNYSGLRQYDGRIINLPATNEFLKAVDATVHYVGDGFCPMSSFSELYLGCPYIQHMDEVWVDFGHRDVKLPFFQNRIGYYGQPPTDVVKRTLDEFFYGSANLDFHVYYELEKIREAQNDIPSFPVLEHLFNRYDFDEYYTDQFRHVWYATTTNEAGEKLKMRISKTLRWEHDDDPWLEFCAGLIIGKAETFDKLEDECLSRRYEYKQMLGIFRRCYRRKKENKGWWKMETAVEPDEEEKGENGALMRAENGPTDEGNTIENE